MYTDHFQLNDDLIQHLDSVLSQNRDAFMERRYVGFLSVSSVTVLELCVKSIFNDFATTQHPILSTFCATHFNRINGRIGLDHIKNEYLPRFGSIYVDQFKTEIDQLEKQGLQELRMSYKGDYTNLITWRNEFTHGGHLPTNATYSDVKRAYESGKRVMQCLAAALACTPDSGQRPS